MTTTLPSSSLDSLSLDSLQPGQLAATLNEANSQNNIEDIYLFDPDFVVKHWSEFRLVHFKELDEYSLSVVGTKRRMRITEEQAKQFIEKMKLVYKPSGGKFGGRGEWVKDTSEESIKQTSVLTQQFAHEIKGVL